MKYMGSKRAMLQNGLGDLLKKEASSATRVIDLFCGAGSVSWFAAANLGKPIVAFDLQKYATVLAGAVIKRTKPINVEKADRQWLSRAAATQTKLKGWTIAAELDSKGLNTATWRKRAQELCASDAAAHTSLIWRCYGGHYFSPTQALSFDAMLRALPENNKLRESCLASIIVAASRCAAAPGHTAQPFKATRTASFYLREAWKRDPFYYARQALTEICALHADQPGAAFVGNANEVATSLRSGDIVFVDPPYSSVQYSRFYHVLETIARGTCSNVEGVGRYPSLEERPNSLYSRKKTSREAIISLLHTLSRKGCTVILTFPFDTCSNGLSGSELEEFAREFFRVTRKSVKTRFSTLGGNTTNRVARKLSDELMLVLKSK